MSQPHSTLQPPSSSSTCSKCGALLCGTWETSLEPAVGSSRAVGMESAQAPCESPCKEGRVCHMLWLKQSPRCSSYEQQALTNTAGSSVRARGLARMSGPEGGSTPSCVSPGAGDSHTAIPHIPPEQHCCCLRLRVPAAGEREVSVCELCIQTPWKTPIPAVTAALELGYDP